MADPYPRTPERALLRRFEPSRLQEQVWALAYEHLWPLARTRIPPPPARRRAHARAGRPVPVVKRA